jgi:hypothetical protein
MPRYSSNVQIPNLPVATSLSGDEQIEIVQNGASRRASASQFGGLSPSGPKGDPGSYIGLQLIGASTDIADRPAAADNGDAWGLITGTTLTIYIWTNGAWYNSGPITTAVSYPIENTIFVAVNGDDANSGSNEATPLATIERALQLATARNLPTLIKIGPGTYQTRGHLDMPDDCAVQGVHRTVFLEPEPGWEQRNVFRMGSGCFVEGIMFQNFQLDSLTTPTEGFAFSFRPGAVIRRVPYAHKCAVRNAQPVDIVGPALDPINGNPDFPRGGGVALADGMVCSQYSIFPNIMTWGATPVVYNGIGYYARRGGLINAVNAISMWAHKHFLATEGGQIILSACATQFGDYSLVADGSRMIVVPEAMSEPLTVQTAAAAAVATATPTIINNMWNYLVANGYTVGWTAEDEAFTRYDASVWLGSVEATLRGGAGNPIDRFQLVLFDTMGDYVFTPDKLGAFTVSFEYMRLQMLALPAVVGDAIAMVNEATAVMVSTLVDPAKRVEPSRIEAIGHTWTANMIGVWAIKIPPADARLPIQESILQTDFGTVIATGQDGSGNAIFAGNVTIDARFGMGGSGFIAPTRREAIRAAITFGGF